MKEHSRCVVCGDYATVFIGNANAPEKQVSLCDRHADHFPEITHRLPNDTRADLLDAALELRRLIIATNSMPFDQQLLPSGSRNPLFGRTDLKGLSPDEFLELTNELDEVGD